MLTSTIVRRTETAAVPTVLDDAPAVRPSYRVYDVSVAAVDRLSDSFARVTFTGPDLHDFGTEGLDQRIKVVLPLPGIGVSLFPRGQAWYDAWRDLPTEHRNPLRTYTVRAVRPVLREVDVVFVTHGDGGPAAQWLQSASVGDALALVGPDALGSDPEVGIEWRPGTSRTVLIAGDETAAPAICSILAALPSACTGCAIIEVPRAGDVQPTDAPAGVQVIWVTRSAEGHGIALEHTVRTVTNRLLGDNQTGSGVYAWLAGESRVIKTLRRFLVTETGMDRRQVSFMGYWRNGRAEHA